MFDEAMRTYMYRDRESEMREILKLAAQSGMFAQPTRGHMSPKLVAKYAAAELLAKCRRMGNANESPWVTFRQLIRRGKVKLIRRPGKPPLLVAVKPRRGHI